MFFILLEFSKILNFTASQFILFFHLGIFYSMETSPPSPPLETPPTIADVGDETPSNLQHQEFAQHFRELQHPQQMTQQQQLQQQQEQPSIQPVCQVNIFPTQHHPIQQPYPQAGNVNFIPAQQPHFSIVSQPPLAPPSYYQSLQYQTQQINVPNSEDVMIAAHQQPAQKRPKINVFPNVADPAAKSAKHCIACQSPDYLYARKEFGGQILCNTCNRNVGLTRKAVKLAAHDDGCKGACATMKRGDAQFQQIAEQFKQKNRNAPACYKWKYFKLLGLQENELDGGTWVKVFGFPMEKLEKLLQHFRSCGIIANHKKAKNALNCVYICFSLPTYKKKALAYNGTLFQKYMIAVQEVQQEEIEQAQTDEEGTEKEREIEGDFTMLESSSAALNENAKSSPNVEALNELFKQVKIHSEIVEQERKSVNPLKDFTVHWKPVIPYTDACKCTCGEDYKDNQGNALNGIHSLAHWMALNGLFNPDHHQFTYHCPLNRPINAGEFRKYINEFFKEHEEEPAEGNCFVYCSVGKIIDNGKTIVDDGSRTIYIGRKNSGLGASGINHKFKAYFYRYYYGAKEE